MQRSVRKEKSCVNFCTCAASVFLFCILNQSASSSTFSRDGIWKNVQDSDLQRTPNRISIPRASLFMDLNVEALKKRLAEAPLEFTPVARQTFVVLDLPLPDGGFETFRIEESPIMEKTLASRYPETRTYRGQGVTDPSATCRIGWSPFGFHALILTVKGTAIIENLNKHNVEHYVAYWEKDYPSPGALLRCYVDDLAIQRRDGERVAPEVPASQGATLRSYRVAIAATGEYTQFFGGTVSQAFNQGIVPMVNQLNAIWEREFTLRIVLVANETSVIYTDPATDPYSDGSLITMLDQNQANLDAVIGSTNYDIGHVVGAAGSGGVAYVGVACNSSFKAQGVSSYGNPNGTIWINDLVAHEFGHQFDADHSFNGTTGFCGGNRAANAAWEPGSGSTIMSYSGSCGAENLQNNSDSLYHVGNYDQIISFTTTGGGNSCATQTSTGNNPPTVNAGPDYTIPQSTPFQLTATASDPDNDALTYLWEEFDLGAAGPPNTDNGDRPIFRGFVPVNVPDRIFPKLSDILNNTSTFGESLPTTNRTLYFRTSVRDNHSGGGGTANDLTQLTVVNGAGPFQITQPNTAVTWIGGTSEDVLWNVANTSSPPINTSNVNILLSTDGGLTFPTALITNTPNDGSQTITVPILNTNMARVKVQAAGNIFFDISNANFTISSSGCGTITLAPPTVPPGTIGTPYNTTITASGGLSPYAFGITLGALPAGLMISNGGVLSGTPTTTGSFNFTVTATDANNCTGSRAYTINVTATGCLLCDDFEDGTLDANWSYVKPAWTEDGHNLVGTPTGKKSIAIASPVFAGCSNCSVQADMQSAGGIGNKLWLLGWYASKQNTVELLMKEENDKWVLKHRVNGVVVSKAKAIQTIDPGVNYNAEITFDGTDFRLYIDGNLLLTLPKAGGSSPFGTAGFEVKRTVGTFGSIAIN